MALGEVRASTCEGRLCIGSVFNETYEFPLS